MIDLANQLSLPKGTSHVSLRFAIEVKREKREPSLIRGVIKAIRELKVNNRRRLRNEENVTFNFHRDHLLNGHQRERPVTNGKRALKEYVIRKNNGTIMMNIRMNREKFHSCSKGHECFGCFVCLTWLVVDLARHAMCLADLAFDHSTYRYTLAARALSYNSSE